MSEIIDYRGDEFDLLAKDMPKEARHIYNFHGSEKIVTVLLGNPQPDGGPYVITAFIDGETYIQGDEIGLTFGDRDELEAMLGFYQDNLRQEIAEEGA